MMFSENYSVLSRVTPRFFALWEGGGHCAVVNCDGEVIEWAGLTGEEEQLCLVEVEIEVVTRHPS